MTQSMDKYVLYLILLLVVTLVSSSDDQHMACNERPTECVNTDSGPMCGCRPGCALIDNECKPICNQTCVFGRCVAPDVCQCDFGYTGDDCSAICECNGHSNCRSADKLSDCLLCHNSTQGPQCQNCKPWFVGNPINSGNCVSCKTYCNSHTDICLNPEIINATNHSVLNEWQSIDNFVDIVKEGALSHAICLHCKNNTEGDRCDACIAGYFKVGEDISSGCRECHCHGHGDMCSPLNGENCNCHNNTENDRQCNQKKSDILQSPCWQLQCSKCKEYFLGTPTNGHHCYRHMFIERDYCFDPNTQEECGRQPNPLLFGRTVFFAVQPRYMNVDIRIVVDVTKGVTDLFLSSKEDTFVVEVNKTSGIHSVWLDKKYSTDIVGYDSIDLDSNDLKNDYFFNDSSHGMSWNSSREPISSLKLRHHSAHNLIYYITITDPNEFLVIRNISNRLVITIPQEVHDLRSTRFYMVLKGISPQTQFYTNGNLFFRQDQSRIDLFVFFSVFFSCFFLFLAACVLIWKIKQAFDLRRARRLHVAVMKTMASRPFSVILCNIDSPSDPDDFEFALSSPTHYIQSNIRKTKGFRFKGSHSSLKDSPKAQIHPEIVDKYLIRPVAIEPTAEGNACVVTTLIQLPGGKCAPNRISLASTLVSIRGSHHILNTHHYNNSANAGPNSVMVWRTAIRRRAQFAF